MSETAVVLPSSKKSSKNIRKVIREKLSLSLADYRSVVGEKKFERRIRKAARVLGQDIANALPKMKKKNLKLVQEKSS